MCSHGSLLKKSVKFNTGVDFVKSRNLYRSRVVWNKKRYEIGMFKTQDEAIKEVRRAKSWIISNPGRIFEMEYE